MIPKFSRNFIVVVTYATCLTKSGRGPRNSSRLGARCYEVRFSSVPPQFRGRKPWGGQGPPTFLPLPPTRREDLRLDGYLEYPHAAKTLYIYKHPCLLGIRTQSLRHCSQRR
ncbi:hypothetical protein TNCV_1412971 [Trichonephila clavipes]|nr:hypothetical protein TNCV_1412971 [Trichonephila clavipes]